MDAFNAVCNQVLLYWTSVGFISGIVCISGHIYMEPTTKSCHSGFELRKHAIMCVFV